ncbi:putative partial NADH-quinone oxidoreductase, subunit M [Nitrospina watsonii]|uniref:Partial NADH-quinone oxidoreductase, subunit M n=2 Tax=Nitrospina watsonii TaxID=1323948 RepID=A0ABM9HBM2_9BACT|nr:putative partial NADH-quinone oxidoreductase, subunit M [Nitrospina watsonii]
MASLKSIGLMTIGVLGAGVVLMGSAFEADPSILLLAGAVLLSGFCGLVGQEGTKEGSAVCASILIVLGLGLGVLLNQGLVSRLFLIGLLGYVAVSLNRETRSSLRAKIIFIQVAIAVALALGSIFSGDTVRLLAGLLLAVTFLPLAPFHLPFVGMLERAKGTLPSFWIVVWLTIGLAELQAIHASLTDDMLLALSLLALASAVYASLACLGQQKSNLFVASATVAHVALVWGLLDIFSSFSRWGIPFGVAVALVMGGVSLAFSFVRQRYGWQTIGKLPGLASPMPRFGTVMVFLVSFAVFLPLFSTFSGLKFMTTAVTHDVGIILILSTFLVVWLGGGWYFSRVLHQTAFGTARPDVPYTDLRTAEFVAVSALLVCAAYSGLIH